MRTVLLGILFALMVAQIANAQTNQRATPVPTPRSSNSPFGSDWAKPDGYIYNDPRLQNNNQPLRPRGRGVCPRGYVLNPANGACY